MIERLLTNLREKRNGMFVVMYHYTRDLTNSRYPQIRGMEYKSFRNQIEFFKDNFHIINIEQLFESFDSGRILPENTLLLTFDDGYIDNYTFAFPVLMEYKVQGTFFIPGKTFTEYKLLDVNKIHFVLASTSTSILVEEVMHQMDYYRGKEYQFDTTEELYVRYAKANRYDDENTIFVKRMLQTVLPVDIRTIILNNLFKKYVGVSEEVLAHELYMSKDQIRVLKKCGMHIGIHGYDHYWLANLNEEQAEKDIQESLNALQSILNLDKWCIAYPYGNYNNSVIRIIQDKGACAAFTTKVDVMRSDNASRFEIPRLDCNDFPPKSNNFLSFMK